MAFPPPFKMLYPELTLDLTTNETPDLYSVKCATRDIKHDYDTSEEDTATACAPFDKTTTVTGEYLELTAQWSHYASATTANQGLFNALYGSRDLVVPFTLVNDARLTAADGGYIEMSGTLRIPPNIPLFGGGGLNKISEGPVKFNIVTGGAAGIAGMTFGADDA